MKIRKVEYAIIGSGTAGLGAYSRIRRKTDNFVIIQHGPYGTTCARVGCMPSKMLIAAADHAHEMQQAAPFGVHGKPIINGTQVFNRIRQDRADKFVGNVLKQIDKIPTEFKLQGCAKFISNNQLQVSDDLIIEADKIIIACGTRPYIPKQLTSVENKILTSDTIFEIDNLPDSIAVIGLGVIALELGQSLHRLGVKTSLYGRTGKIGDLSHPDLQAETLECLSDELDIYPQGRIVEAWEENDAVVIAYEQHNGSVITKTFDVILVAAGRVSNADRMNIHNTDIQLDKAGTPHFDPQTMQCGNLPIYIAGDATNDLPLWHEAYDEGRIAGNSALSYPNAEKAQRKTPLGIYFTDPQMAIVGKSFQQLRNTEIVIGDVPFNSPRHEVWKKTQGRIQVYLDAYSGEILGAELLGYQAEHLAHLLALAITHRMTADQFLEMPIYHPSAEEVLKKALNNARFQLK
ncbi:dihydrolipoyl dehydrogenase [Aliamphritea ceti]|uniref:dihydrolipoyl dehydrogenase n=1 Tax=Aliamphritea ceti TaxID=1524258 RepID=UPI0021C3E568|nr:dihydrolipoyl dehydrogenase [Aliamphritea ceti]